MLLEQRPHPETPAPGRRRGTGPTSGNTARAARRQPRCEQSADDEHERARHAWGRGSARTKMDPERHLLLHEHGRPAHVPE